MGIATSESFSEAPGSEPRTLAALLLESIALRHQIAVLERSRTRRPCFRLWDRLFWILFSRWWPQWRDSLIIVQPETVLRWRRDGWSALWRYRARGRWRGGRPRISSEVRHLIVRMARENFLWGAPRIHGELLMLGFSVSQATVSRYMPARSRRPGQSWRTFLRNQAMAFGHCEYSEEWSEWKRWPTESVLFGPARAIRGCADCDGMGWAQAQLRASTVYPKQSKNPSAVRSVRSRSDASRCLRVERLKKSAV